MITFLGVAEGDPGASGDYAYDACGRLVLASDASGERTYAWDEGFYADSAPGTPGPRESAATAPVGDDGAAH